MTSKLVLDTSRQIGRRRFLAASLAASWSYRVFGAEYPTRTVRIVSGFSPGGPNDVLARLVAEPLGVRLGQPVIVDNRVGAGGAIGAEVVAKSSPDGHTLLMLAVAHCAHRALYPNLNYDVVRDFAPVSLVATQPLVLVVSAQLAVHDVNEFIALAKRQPGKMFYASGGNGTSQHMAMEIFKSATQTQLTHVPYKGLPPAYPDLSSGQIAAAMLPISSALPLIQSNKVRALGLASSKRSRLIERIPTLGESGVASVEVDAWHGLVAPRATPSSVIEVLQRHIAAILVEPALREKLAHQGAEPAASSTSAFAALIGSEVDKYAKIIRAAQIKAE